MRPVSLGQSGRAISEAPVWKKSQEAGRPYSLSVRRPPYLVRRSLSVPDTQNRTEPNPDLTPDLNPDLNPGFSTPKARAVAGPLSWTAILDLAFRTFGPGRLAGPAVEAAVPGARHDPPFPTPQAEPRSGPTLNPIPGPAQNRGFRAPRPDRRPGPPRSSPRTPI